MSKIDEMIERLCPDGVEYKRIDDVCFLKRGKTITKKSSNLGIIPVVAGGREPAYYIDKCNCEGQTITIAGSGAYAGHVLFWNEPIWVGDSFSIKTKSEEFLVSRYLFFVLKNMQTKIYKLKKGSGIPHVKPSDLAPINIPVPPLEIQEEIVRVLDSFVELEAELEAELERRKAQYVYYRDELFLSKVFSTAFLKDLLQDRGYIRGPFGSALRKSEMTNEGIPVYEQQHAIYNHRDFRYYISYEKAKSLSRFKVKQGDLIVSCSGTVGSISIISENDKEGIINQALLILRCDSTIITPQFLKCYLCTTMGRNKLLKQTNKSAQINIAGRDQIEAISIPVPSLEEQQRIVDILDKFDALVNDISQGLPAEIEARRKQYEYYRDKLLTFKEKVN